MTRLKELRKEKGISQAHLARNLGVNQTAVSQWETGRTLPSADLLYKIAEYLEVSVDYLLGRTPHTNPEEARPDPSPAESEKKYTRIHVYGSVPAGVPTEALEDIVDFEDIPTEWLRGGQEYFGLKVKGDSMYPVYLDGDTIIVRKQPTCESGEDCVVYVNGYEATLKRVQLLPDGLRLQPLNPNYPPQTFTKEEVQALPVGIAGVVVELRRTMKKG